MVNPGQGERILAAKSGRNPVLAGFAPRAGDADAVNGIMADRSESTPFWRKKRLSQMTRAEWESLCDGCGRCCLNKLEEEDTGRIYFTDVGCRLLDTQACNCRDYPNRSEQVEDCVRLTPEEVETITWLPPSCAYRLIKEGRDLYWWHPLVSGDPDTVHTAGISVRGRVGISEDEWGDQDLEDRIVDWPIRIPKRGR